MIWVDLGESREGSEVWLRKFGMLRALCWRSPVLHGVEGFLVGDVVHEDEAHGPAVVGGGDGAVPLLPGRVLEGTGDSRMSPPGVQGQRTRATKLMGVDASPSWYGSGGAAPC